MFESVSPAPPDAIFGLNEAMRRDDRQNKINLGAGVYKDETGRTPILKVVKEVEARLLDEQTTKSYLPIDGAPTYGQRVRELVFGAEHSVLKDGRAATIHAPGGTGALRMVAELLRSLGNRPTIWLSSPTWANHPKIFQASGLETRTYAYYDADSRGLDFEGMLDSLRQVGEGDVVVLHGCCHNPTGVDPSLEQWRQIGRVLSDRGAVPLLDFAYQGFVEGVDEDAAGLRALAEILPELFVCSSFSKNFGLYAERVGAATFVAADEQQAHAVLSRAKQCARATYSNPPIHGSAIVTTVLSDDDLRRRWQEELADMRIRVRRMREGLCTGLTERGVLLHPDGNQFIARQNGMFSFSGLTPDEVDRLRDEKAVYVLGSGRINVAGVTEENMNRLCDAIAAVRS